MGRLFLVRHGQASFGTDDYDRLSDLGVRQCEALGAYWRERQQGAVLALHGSLLRQRQSLQAVCRGLGQELSAREWRGLNEYDSDALLRALAHQNGSMDAHALTSPKTVEAAREHFRLLRVALLGWMAGEIKPEGMPSFSDFQAGVALALQQAHEASRDGDVLIVSSGGPISVAVAQVLQAPADTVVALNMRLRNSAVTEMVSTSKGFDLLSFNTLPHLQHDERLMTMA